VHTSTAMESHGVQVRRSEAVIAALRAPTPVQQPDQTATDQTPGSLPQPDLSGACQPAACQAGAAQPTAAPGMDQPDSRACKAQPPAHRAAGAASAQCPSCGCSCTLRRSCNTPTHARGSSVACGRHKAPSADSAAVSECSAPAAANAAILTSPAWPEHAGAAEADVTQERRQSVNQSRHTQSRVGHAHAAGGTSSRRMNTRHDAAPQRQSASQTGSMHGDAPRPRPPATAARRRSSSVPDSGASTRRNTAPGCSDGSGRLCTTSDWHRPETDLWRHKRPSLLVLPQAVAQRWTPGLPARPLEVSSQIRTGNSWEGASDLRQQRARRTSDTWVADRARNTARGVTAAQHKRPLTSDLRRACSMAASKGAPCRSRTSRPVTTQNVAPIPKSRYVVAPADLC